MASPGCGPPSLPVGTEVSAKYRGAFCEATVKTVVRVVKCKVLMKDCQTSIFVNDDEVKGIVKLGSIVEVKHPDTGQPVEATINKLIDHSTYTVVFDDGDERTLRRTQLCLKGDKHFIESETLDNLPLSHPEHFGTPVLQNKKAKRKNDGESDDEDEGSEEESPRRAMYRGRHQELVGKLMLVDQPHRKGSAIPALVVLPDANSLSEIKNRDQVLVRSFKDSKFMVVIRKDLKDFSRVVAIKNDDKTMRTAFEKALLYYDTKELPVGWNKEEMLGSDIDNDDGDEDNEYASEDEPFEEKDRFVAQLYKFMDDRGTPINKGPCIGNKDLNLYKLFKIVQNLGGYNKVTKEMKWPVVYSKMGLPSLHQNPAHQIKSAYKKYLDAYETFYRKLGSTMGTLSRPGRGRQNSGRSILNFRAREKSPRSPKPPEKNKEDVESAKSKSEKETALDKSEDGQDTVSVASTDEGDIVMRRTPRRDARAQANREESKEKKEDTGKAKKDDKKDDIPRSKKDETPASKLKKDETAVSKARKDEAPVVKPKRDETLTLKTKKDETPAAKGRKEESLCGPKTKKEEQAKGKKEEESVKREEKKATRKVKIEEGKEVEKEEKKPVRGVKKEREENKEEKKGEERKEEIKQEIDTLVKESPKKRVTRRKLLTTEVKKEPEPKEDSEEKKEPPKKLVAKETKVIEKKDKEIPRTLERRDSRMSEKKEPITKGAEKKDVKLMEKKGKVLEDKKVKKEKKVKEDGTDESTDDNEEDNSEQEKSDGSSKHDYPIGSKLRVKYGRGKNQKIYIAKVVDFGKDGLHKTYLVHYAGWNTSASVSRPQDFVRRSERLQSIYDEWIRPDRVVAVLDRPGGDKAKTPPNRPPPMPGVLKKAGTPSSITITNKTAAAGRKPGQIFRTPKMIGAKTRATRSSSSDTSIANKRMTRRRSFLTDSTGSKSPESHMSSDAEDATGSEQADDDDNTKEFKDEEDDILDVEEDEGDMEEDESKDKSVDLDTSMEEEENGPKEESASESERVDEEEDKEAEVDIKRKEVKEISDSDSHKGKSLSTETVKIELEVKKENKDCIKPELTKEAVNKSVVEVARNTSVPEIKMERATVVVAEVTTAVDEIRAVVYEDEENFVGLEDEAEEETNAVVSEKETVPTISDESIENENSESPKLEIVEGKEPEDKECAGDKPDELSLQLEKLSENSGVLVSIADHTIPQLKKMDIEPEKKDKEPEKNKMVRGKKKEQARDTKKTVKTSDSSNVSLTPEIPTLEPMTGQSVSTTGKINPSPYDFDAEIDTPWQPEITKKWEPNQKSPVVKESKESLAPAEEGDEKEKKKVKKKAKKKPICPEFVGEEGSLSLDDNINASGSSETLTSPSSGETSIDRQNLKKKGRKKKEVSPETAKEMMEQYESTVNSVVEAVKHSLKESESDHEQRPAVKRRRVKRVSESDKKDVSIRVGKIGRKVASRESLDVLDSGQFDDNKSKKVSAAQSPLQNEPSSSMSSQSNEVTGSSNSIQESEESVMFRDSKREPSFCESQGFEPQLEQHDPSAPFDNTPPTTPEHEEEGNMNAAMQHQQNLYHPDDLSSKSDIQKDNAKVTCSSSSTVSSISLPASSSNIAPSKSASESPSDNDVTSTASTDNMDSAITAQQSENSGTDQDVPSSKKRKSTDDILNGTSLSKKKKRVHGTRSRTAKKSPKYTGNSDSQGSASNTPNHCPESPPNKFADLSKSPRPAKYNFNADLGEYLEGEARCSFLIGKMREIKSIYMNLKAEVALIDRRRKRARRKERESSQMSTIDKEATT